ncbi:MAG: asparaginase [Gemmatimonadaceae bacterium]
MIVILFTGGTIAMRNDPIAGGATPALTADEIVQATHGLTNTTRVETEEWGRFPGPHMTVERMWSLRNRIAEHLARDEVTGVVVTHGTDTMEESAYMAGRSLTSTKPVVFTGAMRTQSDLGWDGPANLLEAVRVAASGAAMGKGVMVVLSGQIFSALDVTKSNTQLLDAFESPGLGPIGYLDEGEVIFRRELPPSPQPIVPIALATPVDVFFAVAGCDSRLLDAVATESRGAVIAAMGRGNVPPEMVPGIARFISAGKPVLITSRTGGGRVGHTYAYPGGGRTLENMGAIMAGARRPQQARIDLMLALGAGASEADLRTLFAG